MFTMGLDDELELIVETARRLAQDELTPRLREAEAARDVGPELRGAFEEIGLAGLELPASLDGAGMGCLPRVLVNEELAAGDAGAAMALDGFGPALTALLETGGEPAVAELAKALDPVRERALLVVESDARIELHGDTLDLEAAWVPCEQAKALVVLTGSEAVLVREGLRHEPLRGAGLRAAGASALRADGAPIAARFESAAGASRALARARLYTASLLLGVMRAACDFATDYSQEREAFGRPIGHHQALAFLLVDMRMALDAARLVVHEAAWRVDAELPCEVEAASAFAECIEASRTLGPNGVQVLGGHGFMADYPVEKHMREARALGLLCGGFDAAVETAAAGLCASPHPLALGAEGAL